jgi:iron complex outermembrane recepter protein
VSCSLHGFQNHKLSKKSIYPIIGLLGCNAIAAAVFPASALAQRAQIEEVVVTAQRRVENLQDVPITITAFGTEDLEMRGIENVQDLNMLFPTSVFVAEV